MQQGRADGKVGHLVVAGWQRGRAVGKVSHLEVAGWQQGRADGKVGHLEVAGWQRKRRDGRWPAAWSMAGSASSAADVAVLEKRRSFGQYMGTRRWRGDEA